MKIKTVEWSVFLNTFVAKRDFDLCISMDAAATEEPDLTFEFHSSQIGDTEYNWATYVNPELDRLLENALATFDIEKRRSYLARAQEILCEDLPVIYLYMQDHLGAISRRIQGPRPYPPPLGIDHNMDWWWIPKELQKVSTAWRLNTDYREFATGLFSLPTSPLERSSSSERRQPSTRDQVSTLSRLQARTPC